MHIATEQLRADGGLPLAGLGPGIQLGDAAGAAHQQGEGQVGGAFGQHVRSVGEHDPAFVEVSDVIVVVAHRDAGHHFQLGGVLQLCTTELAADTDQAVGVGQGFVELGVDVAVFRIRHDDVEVLLQAFDHLRRDATEGEDGFFHGCRLVGRECLASYKFQAFSRKPKKAPRLFLTCGLQLEACSCPSAILAPFAAR
ncbi:hypothetical protein D3C87_1142460 [compost metagenome]